jgi:transcriptional regulator with XRE-family HTH domain
MDKLFSKEQFIKDLKKYRSKNHISQNKLAEQLDLQSPSSLSLIEQGKTYPSKEIFEKFCDLANKQKDSYWYKEEENTPFAFLKGNGSDINSDEIEKLCTNIETREYLDCLKKRYYEK